MKAKNILVAVGIVVVVIVLAVAATSCAGEPLAHTHDATDITSGKLSNSRLNMGSGNGLDADMVDGKHASELGQIPAQHLEEMTFRTDFDWWQCATEERGVGGYLYILSSYYDTGYTLWPYVRITIDDNPEPCQFSMMDYITGGHYVYVGDDEKLIKYAQVSLSVRFDSSLKVEFKSPLSGMGVYLSVIHSTDL